jgi:hypothetical protein
MSCSAGAKLAQITDGDLRRAIAACGVALLGIAHKAADSGAAFCQFRHHEAAEFARRAECKNGRVCALDQVVTPVDERRILVEEFDLGDLPTAAGPDADRSRIALTGYTIPSSVRISWLG